MTRSVTSFARRAALGLPPGAGSAQSKARTCMSPYSTLAACARSVFGYSGCCRCILATRTHYYQVPET